MAENDNNKQEKFKWGPLLAATALILALIIGGVSFFTRDDKPTDSAQPAPAIDGDSRQTVTDRLGRVVYMPENPAGDVKEKGKIVESTTQAPADLEWQRLSGQTSITTARDYPFSSTAGPWETSDGFAHTFAHSPQGAALAGIHIVLGVGTSGEKAAQVMKYFSADQQAQDAAQYMLDHPDGAQMPETPWTSTFRAYQVVSYTDDEATIRYAMPAGDNFQKIDIKLVWKDGDWRLKDANAVSDTTPVSTGEVETWLQL